MNSSALSQRRARCLAAASFFVAALSAHECRSQLLVDARVLEDEARRVETIERISRSTIAVLERSGENGGSGVIIDPDGFALTNYHVVSPCGPHMLVGTSDGDIHEAVLVGLDPTGDLALIKLIGEGPFEPADIGESDAVRVGDEAIVAGNPFMLAEDFSPSISVGIVSGVRRYQHPSDSILEYADCIQTDAAINPGNSGGPLFDGQGRLIGINGRASFEKRGRVNVGVGYAVSINQAMRFLPQLKSGLVVDHAALGATGRTMWRDSGSSVVVDAIDRTSDAYRAGLRLGDELISIDDRNVSTANELLNAIGALPPEWRVRLRWRRRGEQTQAQVRLGELHRPGELREILAKTPVGTPGQSDRNVESGAASSEYYEPRSGFANYYYTRIETDRILNAWTGSCQGAGFRGDATVRLRESKSKDRVTLRLHPKGAEWTTPRGKFRFDASGPFDLQRAPLAAPNLLAGLWLWWKLSLDGPQELDLVHCAGAAPWDAGGPLHDVLVIEHRGARIECYFDQSLGSLRGFESYAAPDEPPTRVGFGDTHQLGVPSDWILSHGDSVLMSLRLEGSTLRETAPPTAP